MTKVTWLGDEDPSAQTVRVGGRTFVKGEAVDVPKDELGKIAGNPLFSTDSKAQATPAVEPPAPDVDAGTVKAALREELRAYGVTMQGNPSEDTLRNKLAEAAATADKARA